MARFDLAHDPDGFSHAVADAVGVVRREAFGVRQLAAALFSCPNTVSVPISRIPHQPDDRSCDAFRSRKSGHRTCTGWVRARMPALLHALEKATALGSAAVLGRINPMAEPTPRLDHANAASEHSPAGHAQTTCLSLYSESLPKAVLL
ncbi:MAG: hypothetical protein GX456_04590 [Verrucomicrobia bacterium]|nr:hypothetical protein [Verrucomicrobiota bacterium]